MSQQKQTYATRRLGAGDMVLVREGHPVTVSVDKESFAYKAQVIYTNSPNPSLRAEADWFGVTFLNFNDETDVAVPLTATAISCRVTEISGEVTPRRGALMEVTSSEGKDLAGFNNRKRPNSGKQYLDFASDPLPQNLARGDQGSSFGQLNSFPEGAGSTYSINARDFPTGEADSTVFTFSCWMRQPFNYVIGSSPFPLSSTLVESTRNTVPEPGFNGSTPYAYRWKTTPFSRAEMNSFPSTFTLNSDQPAADSDNWPGDGIWHHIMASSSHGVAQHLYIDGVDHLQFGLSNGTPYVWEDGDVITHSIGGKHQQIFNGQCAITIFADLAEIFFDPQNYMDLSIQGERDKLYNADGTAPDLGVDGSTPTGSQPAIYCSNGDPSSNTGRWGPYTLVGPADPGIGAQVAVRPTDGPNF